jgi:hypothetical protein
MRPPRPIQRENAIAQQRVKLLVSSAETEILELRRQNSLDILRLDGCCQCASQKLLTEGVGAMDGELIGKIIDPALFAHSFAQAQECGDPEESGVPIRREFTV